MEFWMTFPNRIGNFIIPTVTHSIFQRGGEKTPTSIYTHNIYICYNSAIHNQRIVVNIPKIPGEASLCHESKTVLPFSIRRKAMRFGHPHRGLSENWSPPNISPGSTSLTHTGRRRMSSSCCANMSGSWKVVSGHCFQRKKHLWTNMGTNIGLGCNYMLDVTKGSRFTKVLGTLW